MVSGDFDVVRQPPASIAFDAWVPVGRAPARRGVERVTACARAACTRRCAGSEQTFYNFASSRCRPPTAARARKRALSSGGFLATRSRPERLGGPCGSARLATTNRIARRSAAGVPAARPMKRRPSASPRRRRQAGLPCASSERSAGWRGRSDRRRGCRVLEYVAPEASAVPPRAGCRCKGSAHRPARERGTACFDLAALAASIIARSSISKPRRILTERPMAQGAPERNAVALQPARKSRSKASCRAVCKSRDFRSRLQPTSPMTPPRLGRHRWSRASMDEVPLAPDQRLAVFDERITLLRGLHGMRRHQLVDRDGFGLPLHCKYMLGCAPQLASPARQNR